LAVVLILVGCAQASSSVEKQQKGEGLVHDQRGLCA
jgi:hypothetical protein